MRTGKFETHMPYSVGLASGVYPSPWNETQVKASFQTIVFQVYENTRVSGANWEYVLMKCGPLSWSKFDSNEFFISRIWIIKEGGKISTVPSRLKNILEMQKSSGEPSFQHNETRKREKRKRDPKPSDIFLLVMEVGHFSNDEQLAKGNILRFDNDIDCGEDVFSIGDASER